MHKKTIVLDECNNRKSEKWLKSTCTSEEFLSAVPATAHRATASPVGRSSKANCYCEAVTFSNRIMTKRSVAVGHELLSPSVGVGNSSVERSFHWRSEQNRSQVSLSK